MRYVTISPKAISHKTVLASDVVITSLETAQTVLKLVATLSCHVLILPHQPGNELQESGATFVAIYAVGILSCNLAVTASVVTSPTAREDKLYVNVFHTGVITGEGQDI